MPAELLPENMTFDELAGKNGLLPFFQDEKNKIDVVESFLLNHRNSVNYNQLNTLLSFFKDEDNKSEVIVAFLSNHNNSIEFDQLVGKGLLSLFKDDDNKSEVIIAFLTNHNNSIEFDKLVGGGGLLSLFNYDSDKFSIVVAFLSNPNRSIEYSQLIGQDGLLSLFEQDKNKSIILELCRQKSNNDIKYDQLVGQDGLLSLFHSEISKSAVAVEFLSNRNNHIEYGQLVGQDGLLSFFEHNDYKAEVAIEFLSNPINFIRYNQLVGQDGLLSFFDDEDDKRMVAAAFLKNNNSNLDDLVEIIKLCGSSHLSNSIINLYKSFVQEKYDNVNIIDDFINISNELGHHEFIKVEIMMSVIYEFRDQLVADKDNTVSQLKKFLDRVEDEKSYQDILTFIAQESALEAMAILLLSRGRINSKYSSIKNILDNQEGITNSLQSCLTPEGIRDLQELFGDNILSKMIDGKRISLSDIFSYFDAQSDLDGFTHIVKPEIIASIRESFHPSKDILLISEHEMEKIKSLLGDDNVDQRYISLAGLCSIVEKRQQELNFEYNGKGINFDGVIISDGERKRLNTLFSLIHADLSKNTNLFKQNAIKTFFEDLRGEEIEGEEREKIGEEAKEELYNFLKGNIDKVAYALTSKEIGAETFGCIISSLIDGCQHNIGSQLNLLINNTIFKNIDERIVYSVTRKVVINIFNSNDDLIGVESDPFKNSNVVSCFTSPSAFLIAIAHEIKELLEGPKRDQEEMSILGALDLGGNKFNGITNVMNYLIDSLKVGSEEKGYDEIDKNVRMAIGYMMLGKFFENNPQLGKSLDDLDFSDLKFFDLSIYLDAEQNPIGSNKANIEELCGVIEELIINNRPRSVILHPNSRQLDNNPAIQH